MAFRSLVSISSSWLSSAILKTIFKIEVCRSFSSRIRPSSSGPISETVVRRGMPFCPKISHKVTGQPLYSKPASARPNFWIRFCMSSVSTPGHIMPATSPFTSAMNTGTPMSLKLSAITFRVMVLPVPVAPAIRPWRFAIFGRIKMFSPLSLFATQIFPSFNMLLPPSRFRKR